jgi:glycosyltransferase involved in cell wall biosynthesis
MGVAGVPAVEAGASRPAGPLRFAAFGLVTQEKRIPQALRALAAVGKVAPDARLTLVGGTTDHYDVRAEAAALGIADRVDITGYVPDEDLPAHLAAADVCICLRWPTARETSASWLRCLAAGKPTIVTDLTHLVDVPTLDPRSWTLLHARADAASVGQPPTVADAVAVSIDILDEDHSLELAMRRLALDVPLRERLGRAARRYWEATATLPLMLDDYMRVLANAAARPAPDPARLGLPAHLLEDHASHGRQIAGEFGVPVPW